MDRRAHDCGDDLSFHRSVNFHKRIDLEYGVGECDYSDCDWIGERERGQRVAPGIGRVLGRFDGIYVARLHAAECDCLWLRIGAHHANDSTRLRDGLDGGGRDTVCAFSLGAGGAAEDMTLPSAIPRLAITRCSNGLQKWYPEVKNAFS